MDEKLEIGKILVICANGDKSDNLYLSSSYVKKLVKEKFIKDIPYEYTSINPDDLKIN